MIHTNPFVFGGFVPVNGDWKLAKKIVKDEIKKMSQVSRLLTYHNLVTPIHLLDGTDMALSDKGRLMIEELKKYVVITQ